MTGLFGHTTCLASSAKYSKTTHRVTFGSSARLNALWADKKSPCDSEYRQMEGGIVLAQRSEMKSIFPRHRGGHHWEKHETFAIGSLAHLSFFSSNGLQTTNKVGF